MSLGVPQPSGCLDCQIVLGRKGAFCHEGNVLWEEPQFLNLHLNATQKRADLPVSELILLVGCSNQKMFELAWSLLCLRLENVQWGSAEMG